MLTNREGQRIPSVVFRTRRNHEWVDVRSEDVLEGRTVVVFALPGAFTPTCSSTHVPRYNQLAPLLMANGVDEVICVSVNDAFVMNEWRQEQKAHNITFLPDGNGDFSRGMGMLVNKDDLGFGERSWRYSMLVRDGVIEKMFIEPEVPGDPFEVSDADTMLAYVAPHAHVPTVVFAHPPVGAVGLTEAEACARHAKVQVYETQFSPLGQAFSAHPSTTAMKPRVWGVRAAGGGHPYGGRRRGRDAAGLRRGAEQRHHQGRAGSHRRHSPHQRRGAGDPEVWPPRRLRPGAGAGGMRRNCGRGVHPSNLRACVGYSARNAVAGTGEFEASLPCAASARGRLRIGRPWADGPPYGESMCPTSPLSRT